MAETLSLRPDETLLAEARFRTSGLLRILVAFLGPFLKSSPSTGAWITDRRVVKRAGGTDLELPLDRLATAYHNTTSGSLALVTNPSDMSLLLELVENGPELVAALRKLGIKVEEESMSPRRPFLR